SCFPTPGGGPPAMTSCRSCSGTAFPVVNVMPGDDIPTLPASGCSYRTITCRPTTGGPSVEFNGGVITVPYDPVTNLAIAVLQCSAAGTWEYSGTTITSAECVP
ncbi:hypothetical protein PMAYCL1PPCAC_21672, partial [Pristionchus mayeri]